MNILYSGKNTLIRTGVNMDDCLISLCGGRIWQASGLVYGGGIVNLIQLNCL